MATLNAYVPIDMVSSGVGGGEVTISTSTHIQIVDGDEVLNYYGSDFAYDPMTGELVGGTLTSIENFLAGSPTFSVAGLGHNMVVFNDFLLADDLNGALGYLFAGDDTLYGSSGNDVLIAYGGNDRLYGGAGNDRYHVVDAGDLVIEAPDAGTDMVRTWLSYALPQNVENLTLTGTGNSSGTGNALPNALIGNAGANLLRGLSASDTLSGAGGNDTLDGGLGADSMRGGAGDDVYVLNDAGDQVVEARAAGTDLVRSSVSFLLPANVENLTLAGPNAISGTGNALGNLITGNGAANLLAGGSGRDTLVGGAGNDTLNGGAGFDSLAGGKGNDVYAVDFALPGYGLLMQGEPGEWISGGQGHFYTSDTGTFSAPQLSDFTGDGLIDYLRLHYSDGAHSWDLVFGTNGLGENFAAGTYEDARRAAFAEAAPGLDVSGDGRGSNEVFGRFAIHAVEFDYSGDAPALVRFAASFEQHSESILAPALTGTINYNYDASIEPVVEQPGEGVDTIRSSVSAALPANVENLVLIGTAAIDGTGNAAANRLTGNAAANVLRGMAGNDTLAGGAGADELYGGEGNDTLLWDKYDAVVSGAGGHDRLQLGGSVALNLTAIDNGKITGIERIVLAGSNTLKLAAQDLLDLSDTTNRLYVDGGAEDAVQLVGAWAALGVTDGYATYKSGAAVLLLDSDIPVPA